MSRSRQTMIKAMRPRCAWLPAVSGAALLAMFCVGRPCAAQAKTPILIDASQPYSEPEAARRLRGRSVEN